MSHAIIFIAGIVTGMCILALLFGWLVRYALKAADVQHEFLYGGLCFRDAVLALQKLGYDPKEATQVVSEWGRGTS